MDLARFVVEFRVFADFESDLGTEDWFSLDCYACAFQDPVGR